MQKQYKSLSEKLPADRDEWIEFVGMNPSPDTLCRLGISPTAWMKIRNGKAPLVARSAFSLARFTRYGSLEDLAGDDWHGFFIAGNALLVPGLINPIPASELRALWCDLRELGRLRFEVQRLRELADEVEISPRLVAWLDRLGKRPLSVGH